MTRYQRILFRLAAIGLIGTTAMLISIYAKPAHGQDVIADGTVDSGGYSYHAGFWWMNGRAYSRYKYQCCTSHTGWCWGYRLAPYANNSAGVTVINNLVGIPVPVSYTQPQAQQGTTTYGYSSLSYTPPEQINYSRLYQQAGRLAEQAQALNSDATNGFMRLVQEGGAQQNEAAKVIAQGMAAAAALQAAKPAASQPIQQQISFSMRQNPNGQWSLEQGSNSGGGSSKIELSSGTGPAAQPAATSPALNANQIAEFKTNLTASCASCHNGANAKTKLDLRDATGISDEVAAAMVARITADDPAKRMPPAGSPALSPRQLKVFFEALVD